MVELYILTCMMKVLLRIAGLCGVLGPVLAFVFISVSVVLHPWVSWVENALSDLGALGVSFSFVYNVGLVVTGFVFVLFGVRLLRRSVSLRILKRRIIGLGMKVYSSTPRSQIYYPTHRNLRRLSCKRYRLACLSGPPCSLGELDNAKPIGGICNVLCLTKD